MKKLQKSIEEYQEKKHRQRNKYHKYLEKENQLKKERIEKRNEFLAKDRENDDEKEEMGKAILKRFDILTSDEVFMKGLKLANNSNRIRKIFETPAKNEGEYTDDIQEKLGSYKRQVTHAFGCNNIDELFYYQYWTPTGFAEGMACAHYRKNKRFRILLRNPSDFRLLSYNAVYALHNALQTDKVIDRLSERIASKQP